MSLAPSRRGDPIAEINVTPMADILIVVLLIFMVVATLVARGVPLALPRAANAREGARGRIQIAIDRKEQAFLDDIPMDVPALAREVRARLESGASGTITVRADEGVSFAVLSKVLEVCRESGAVDVALATSAKVPS
jgi:biopolymer transport protein ExbD